MLQPPFNNLLLKIGDAFIKQYGSIAKTSMMYAHGSDINPADMVNIVGEVVALPLKITTNTPGYEGYSTEDIHVGDTAIFRYDVIYEFIKDERFKNLFWYRGKEYWAANITRIFGVIRRGEIIMINGYCMIESINNPSNIILPHTMKNIDGIGWATLTQMGNNRTHMKTIEAMPGDTVFFDPRKLQRYEIGKKKFGIIRQQQIFGVQNKKTEYI